MAATQSPSEPTYVIEGKNIFTLDDFYDEVSRVLVPDLPWGRNLDAFSDVVRGYGTPEGGFTLVWKDSALSMSRLSYEETARQLRAKLRRCHPTAKPIVEKQLADAEQGEGETIFDWLVEIIRNARTVRLILD